MILNLCAFSAFAFDREESVDLSKYNQSTVREIKELGVFTDEDTQLLMEYDIAHSNIAPARVTLPSNPKDGDVVYDTFRISKSTFVAGGSGAVGIALAIAKMGNVPVAVCTAVAAVIFNLMADNTDFEAIEITVKWRYGLTDDLTMGWTSTISNYQIIYS